MKADACGHSTASWDVGHSMCSGETTTSSDDGRKRGLVMMDVSHVTTRMPCDRGLGLQRPSQRSLAAQAAAGQQSGGT